MKYLRLFVPAISPVFNASKLSDDFHLKHAHADFDYFEYMETEEAPASTRLLS